MENKEFILDQTTIKKLLVTYKLRIPDFQRSFVWKPQKKYQLLQSLFRGFPIGAITLYEDDGAYYIIDGLQRINTLQQYLSCPSKIIGFTEYFKKVEREVKEFLKNNNIKVPINSFKSAVKLWYEQLNELYAYEKVSPLYRSMKEKCGAAFKGIDDEMQMMEDLSEILIGKIEISHDAIALIVYQGDKDDLPDLFKNINTGSVALSQYEILQSLWVNYKLDKGTLGEEYNYYMYALDMIKEDYEIQAIKESGDFDIFKNIIGLNFKICCMEKASRVLSPALKIIKPITTGEYTKFYDNDSIGFELYSTLVTHTPNRIVKAVDLIFRDRSTDQCVEISRFVRQINEVLYRSIKCAIDSVNKSGLDNIFVSKYHSLYVVAGIALSLYRIDAENLRVTKIPINKRRLDMCTDFETHKKGKWFVDENRQISFFNNKMKELIEDI
ncbi:MAG: DUF262 domain-containing protein [Lachnospiraceae bacterium]|jgi:hypothetical protein|nr:DUF262 domain-containing protein [Lachnospiraceae bacterium]